MLYDTHAHLDLINEDYLEELIENAKKENVKYIVSQTVNLPSLKKTLKIRNRFPKIVKLSVGLYPEEDLKLSDFEELKKFVKENKEEIYAIGEIGMDFSHEKPDKKIQEEIFRKQLSLAQELNLPVSIHTRKAEKEIIEVLKEYPKVKKVLHCFSGKLRLAKEANDIGCYFSIPTNIVRSQHFQKLVQIIPRNKILTETDSPYLSPFKEKDNEPANIIETIKLISLLWKEPVEKVEEQVKRNFISIYN